MQTFTKDCKNAVSVEIYESIKENCADISLAINKLVQIIKIVNEGD
jgi:hypothetical protein